MINMFQATAYGAVADTCSWSAGSLAGSMTCMIVSGYSLQSGRRHLLLECGLSGWVYDVYGCFRLQPAERSQAPAPGVRALWLGL